MNTEWITDRLPTQEDGYAGDVWVTDLDGELSMKYFKHVALGRPWQPIHKPAPYVEPKRSKVPPPPPPFKEMVANSTVMLREGELP